MQTCTVTCRHFFVNIGLALSIVCLYAVSHSTSHSLVSSLSTMQATLVAVCCLSAILNLATSSCNKVTPVVYIKTTSESQCDQQIDSFQNDPQLIEALKIVQQQLPPPGGNNLFLSCMDILCRNSSASSGYYQIQAANGSTVQVYCDMEGTNCGGERGWMRVAYFNMTDPSSQCPASFRIETANNKRFCIRDISSAGCGSMLFESFELPYSQVCGYVRGYSQDSTDAFANPVAVVRNVPLSGNYVDGVSITYGTPPTHLWTYAAGSLSETHNVYNCPCNTPPGIQAPSFISNDFYCEAGAGSSQSGWHTSDPLWDGMQCGGQEVPCCNHTGLPWFHKNTLTSTTAPIKVRLCVDEASNNENIGIERLELYVK